MSGEDRVSFIVDWYDTTACLVRQYQFTYFPRDHGVEMYDVKNRRQFLKRTKCEEVSLGDLYVGATVNVFSRQLNFVDFGDENTRRIMARNTEKILVLVKPHAVKFLGEIMQLMSSKDLHVTNLKMLQLSASDAEKLVGDCPSGLSGGSAMALEVMGPAVVAGMQMLAGPEDPAMARMQAPQSLRAQWGQDIANNAIYMSTDLAAAARQLAQVFPVASSGGQSAKQPPVGRSTAKLSGATTLCVIKPHALQAPGCMAGVLQDITDAGFSVETMQMFHVDQTNAEEFLEVYKGVVAEYYGMLNEFTAGPCLALELSGPSQGAASGDNVSAQQAFRQLCGPADPEIARHLRPNTLRAKYGKDKVRNAVHCTDLPEDAALEVEYFFQILAN